MSKAYSWGSDVGQIRRDTWSVHNIVEGQLIDQRASFQEQGKRLYRDCQ
jgi:hypothetical protein